MGVLCFNYDITFAFGLFVRVPCEEEINQESKPDDESKRPSVKRHKLGTTTITNTVTDNKEDLSKLCFFFCNNFNKPVIVTYFSSHRTHK